MRRVRNVDLRNWSVCCAVFALTALLPFFGLIVWSYRWSLLLAIPMCVYATVGLFRVRSGIQQTTNLASILGRNIVPTFGALLTVSAILYIALPAQSAFVYYAALPGPSPYVYGAGHGSVI